MTEELAQEADPDLPLETVGAQLRRVREAAGLSLAQVAAETRIGQRQLTAIEDGNYAALPGRTYAVGFARTYAKFMALNAVEIAESVRRELDEQAAQEPRRPVQTFEPGDPARVPSARLAWGAAAVIVTVIFGTLVVWPAIFSPGGKLASILASESPAPTVSQAPASAAPLPAPAPAPALSGPVVFTALDAAVWVKFTDAAGNQLFQKEMTQGETFTVPVDAGEVFIRTARPDALAITIGGQAVPKLAEVQQTISNVPVSAAALLGRGNPASTDGTVATPNGAAVPQAPVTQQRRTAPLGGSQRIPQPRIETSPAPADLPSTAIPAPTRGTT